MVKPLRYVCGPFCAEYVNSYACVCFDALLCDVYELFFNFPTINSLSNCTLYAHA